MPDGVMVGEQTPRSGGHRARGVSDRRAKRGRFLDASRISKNPSRAAVQHCLLRAKGSRPASARS